jgi:ATPase family associated with various cellular activities (AAA)/Sigma-54 interaction domain
MTLDQKLTVRGLLEAVYPGEAQAFARFREQIEEITTSPGPLALLLEGPPGVGKTTVARAVALARALALVSPDVHLIGPERGPAMVLETRQMSWFRDLSLSGLSREFADTALFGIVPKGATSVEPRIGIIEQSMTNAGPPDAKLNHPQLVAVAKERGSWIPLITGGVVLLDEIGDAEEWIQLKLLRLLNGETVSRVQGEGLENWSFAFHGIVILATWKPTSALRPDLLQRIGQHRLRVPGLSEYPIEARELVITSIVSKYQERAREEISRLEQLKGTNKASDAWTVRIGQAVSKKLTQEQIARLAKQDWENLGEFRGVTKVVMDCLTGRNVSESIDSMRRATRILPAAGSESDASRLQRYLESYGGISNGWRADKISWAERIAEALSVREPQLMSFLIRNNIDQGKLRKDLNNILRASRDGKAEDENPIE